MQPTTLIELTMLFGAVIVLALLAFLLPKKRRKIAWSIAGVAFIIGISFYSIRPFIVQHQTDQAFDTLASHLDDTYPDELRTITDTDSYQLEFEKHLHVIFNNEPEVVYEYRIEDGEAVQVNVWLRDGDSIESSDVEPQHLEGNRQG